MLRPKNCKKCGGKMQTGGQLDFSWFNPQAPIDAPIGVDPVQIEEENRIQEMINRGLIDIPNSEGTSEQEYLNALQQEKRKKTPVSAQNIGILMQGLRTGLSEISGRIDRGRQNRYDWMQQAALGQINPMPVDDFQPNPYSLYAKYGGKLKNYQTGGQVFTSQQQIDQANALAKRFALEHGTVAGENAYVARKIGDPVPQFIDSKTGKPYIPAPVKSLSKTVPSGITIDDIQSAEGMYWYNDPSTGDIVDVDPHAIFALPQFRQASQERAAKEQLRMSVAKLRKGGRRRWN